MDLRSPGCSDATRAVGGAAPDVSSKSTPPPGKSSSWRVKNHVPAPICAAEISILPWVFSFIFSWYGKSLAFLASSFHFGLSENRADPHLSQSSYLGVILWHVPHSNWPNLHIYMHISHILIESLGKTHQLLRHFGLNPPCLESPWFCHRWLTSSQPFAHGGVPRSALHVTWTKPRVLGTTKYGSTTIMLIMEDIYIYYTYYIYILYILYILYIYIIHIIHIIYIYYTYYTLYIYIVHILHIVYIYIIHIIHILNIYYTYYTYYIYYTYYTYYTHNVLQRFSIHLPSY